MLNDIKHGYQVAEMDHMRAQLASEQIVRGFSIQLLRSQLEVAGEAKKIATVSRAALKEMSILKSADRLEL
jgi:hypothetical protein